MTISDFGRYLLVDISTDSRATDSYHSMNISSLKFNISPLKIGRNAPIGKDRIPIIHFQVRTVSFRGCNWLIELPDWLMG